MQEERLPRQVSTQPEGVALLQAVRGPWCSANTSGQAPDPLSLPSPHIPHLPHLPSHSRVDRKFAHFIWIILDLVSCPGGSTTGGPRSQPSTATLQLPPLGLISFFNLPPVPLLD